MNHGGKLVSSSAFSKTSPTGDRLGGRYRRRHQPAHDRHTLAGRRPRNRGQGRWARRESCPGCSPATSTTAMTAQRVARSAQRNDHRPGRRPRHRAAPRHRSGTRSPAALWSKFAPGPPPGPTGCSAGCRSSCRERARHRSGGQRHTESRARHGTDAQHDRAPGLGLPELRIKRDSAAGITKSARVDAASFWAVCSARPASPARLSRVLSPGAVRRPAGGASGSNVNPHLDHHPRKQHART